MAAQCTAATACHGAEKETNLYFVHFDSTEFRQSCQCASNATRKVKVKGFLALFSFAFKEEKSIPVKGVI